MLFEDFFDALTSPALRAVVAHWGAARGARAMPGWQQLQPARMARQLPIIWVYRYDAAAGQFTGRLAGDRITRGFAKSFRGTRLEDLHPATTLSAVQAYMTRVVREPSLYMCRGALFRQADRVAEGERIMLPLAGDGIHGDGVLGASDYHYPVANADYAPIELLTEGEQWHSLTPGIAAAA